MMISKKDAKEALNKYGIEFGFPGHARGGNTITVWTDLYHQTTGNTHKLRKLIDDDKSCPFRTCADVMLSTFGLIRK